MPAERVAMRRAREIIHLKFSACVPTREIARRLGIAASTVRETLRTSRKHRPGLASAGRYDIPCRAGVSRRLRAPRGARLGPSPDSAENPNRPTDKANCGEAETIFWNRIRCGIAI